MKIVSLLGSPRKKANSALIAEKFCAEAKKFGAQVKTFELNALTYQACQGCNVCKTKLDRCVLKDDLTEVLDSIREADILVLASPVYFWDVTAQVKGFLDRCFSFLTPNFITAPNKSRLPSGKKLLMILTQGNTDRNSFTNIFEKFDYFFRMFGFTDTRQIRAFGTNEPGMVETDQEIMELAAKTAQQFCS